MCNWIIGVFLIATVGATLDPEGTKCGQKRCSTIEYCSPYDMQCLPCSKACDTSSHNYQPESCLKDCQEFLHDQRYVLRRELGREVASRDYGQTQINAALGLSLISLIGVIFLYLWTFLRGKKLRIAWEKICGTKWSKKKMRNKVRDDVEAGPPKQQNGLKLAMPTISRSVAVASQGTNCTNGSTSSTPNTTSTPLSRRHPSEDTTLDYAYDNPAMTPSPESAAAKTKKESSF